MKEEQSRCPVCGGTFQEIAVWVKPDGGWDLIRRCARCGELSAVPVPADADPATLLSLASRPLANPPFPLERLEEMAAMTGGGGALGARAESGRERRRRKYEKGYYKDHPCLESFTCKVCGREVSPGGAGSEHRNHCPYCLTSLHVDREPGDRESECHAVMEPAAVWVRRGGEWALIHRCTACGKLSSNRVAADDDPKKLLALALRPFGGDAISRLPVRERIQELEG